MHRAVPSGISRPVLDGGQGPGVSTRSVVTPSTPRARTAAQARWRAVNAPHLVALVRAGARFEGGHRVERSESLAA